MYTPPSLATFLLLDTLTSLSFGGVRFILTKSHLAVARPCCKLCHAPAGSQPLQLASCCAFLFSSRGRGGEPRPLCRRAFATASLTRERVQRAVALAAAALNRPSPPSARRCRRSRWSLFPTACRRSPAWSRPSALPLPLARLFPLMYLLYLSTIAPMRPVQLSLWRSNRRYETVGLGATIAVRLLEGLADYAGSDAAAWRHV